MPKKWNCLNQPTEDVINWNLSYSINCLFKFINYKTIVYNRDLDSDILNNKNGDRNNLYYALASGQRQENHGYDLESVKKDAEALAAVYILNLLV